MKLNVKNKEVSEKTVLAKNLDSLAKFLSRNVAMPLGLVTADLDILLRVNGSNTNGFTYFDALPIAFFSMPLAKKILDKSLEKLEENIYFKNKKTSRYTKIGILSTATYFVSEACATYNAVVNNAVSKPLDIMSNGTAGFFFLGITSLGVGLVSLGLNKRVELKQYKRE